MASRPVVSVFSSDGKRTSAIPLPVVFSAPLRSDLVRIVHTNMSKNRRQAYAVSKMSGYQTSAESWGTGRAMARVPRVQGGGTHRAGQAAYANFCRAGGMFAPTKIWRRWHRRVNVKEKRFALSSALAATCVVPLVMARGHSIDAIPEVPLVVRDEDLAKITKTSEAVEMLNRFGLASELARAQRAASKKSRSGRSGRSGRKGHGTGPLVILESVANGRAFRNIPGVEVADVKRLNLLKLAPAGVMGRLCIWSEGAMARVDRVVGCRGRGVVVGDLSAVVNSSQVQSVLGPQRARA